MQGRDRRRRSHHPHGPARDPRGRGLRGRRRDRPRRPGRRAGPRRCSPTWPSSTSRCRAWTALEAARIINAEKLCGVLMLTAFSQREVVEEARDAGALAYLVKPFQKSDLIPAIEVAIGRFRELRALTGEIDALGEQLEARKSIERAKGVLMDELRDDRAGRLHLHPAHGDERAHEACATSPSAIIDGTLRAVTGSRTDGQAAAPRRQLADLPRLLRPADRHGDGQRAGDQRRVRVHVDVHQRAEGPASPTACSSPSTGPSRRSATRPTATYKAQPRGGARHPAPADGPGARGARRARRRHDRAAPAGRPTT